MSKNYPYNDEDAFITRFAWVCDRLRNLDYFSHASLTPLAERQPQTVEIFAERICERMKVELEMRLEAWELHDLITKEQRKQLLSLMRDVAMKKETILTSNEWYEAVTKVLG